MERSEAYRTRMTEVLHTRVTPQHITKVQALADANGTTRGWVLRQLIDKAELITPALFAGNLKLDHPRKRRSEVTRV